MINFDRIVPKAAEAAGDRPILAAPYPLPNILCRELSVEDVISGYVAESCPNSPDRDSVVAGWWIDHKEGSWFLRRGASRTILLLSVQSEEAVSGRMLLEARLKGYERILLVSHDGSIEHDIDIGSALMRRLGSAMPVVSYDDAFDEMYSLLGDKFRLNERAFDPDLVLIYTPNLDAGGAQRQATYTALGLAKRRPGNVHVARIRSAAGLDDFYKPVLDAANIPTHVMSDEAPEYSTSDIIEIRNKLAARYASLGFLHIFHMVFHQAILISKIRPGLVHSFQDYANIPAGLAADLVGVPRLVLSGRSVAPDNFEIFQPSLAPAYHALLKRRQLTFLNNSEAGASDYARWLRRPRDQFRVIRNGFEFPERQPCWAAHQRNALGVPKGAVLIGSIIGFREEKRPQLFLEMARLLHGVFPDAHFVIFGDGPLLPACRDFVKSHALSAVVHLPGTTDNAWPALSAMDIFVLASRMEGLPNVMIEAQAMGLPVVCTAAGGMRETFIEGETGFGVSATAEAMSTCVRRLIEDDAFRTRIAAAAVRYARETFGIDQMIDRTMEAYADTPVRRSDTVPDWASVESPLEIKLDGAVKDGGYAFVTDLPANIDCSDLFLWEDDHWLGAATSDPEDVRSAGCGHYAVLSGRILFSSSDQSDVRFNGRVYRLRPANADPDFDEIVVKPNLIVPEIGHCYIARLGLEDGSARIGFWENDTRLGPGGCLHDQVRTQGMGCYSVWGPDLYFSTSDNSDPRANGRIYLLRRGRKAAAADPTAAKWAGAPLERIMHHMLSTSTPRHDFVPGRIVHVIGSLGPGGAERQALHTLTGLHGQSFESVQLLAYYLAPSGSERHDFYLPAVTAAGIPVRTIRRRVGDNEPGNMPPSVCEVWQALPEGLAPDISDLFWEFLNLRPEIVHTWLDGNNIRAGLAAALAGVPRIILSGRNVNPSHFQLYRHWMDPAYKALLRLPHVTMVNNSYVGRDDYARWLEIEPERIIVIHNGCDYPPLPAADTRRASREAYDISPEAIVVGTVTRMAEEKRPHLFVEMAQQALQRQPNLHFLFFGSGPLHDETQSLIDRLRLFDSIKLMGITDDIWTSLAAMDVFVLTSRMEGLPNVLIEAQCAGIPVVATKVGGAPETFIDGKTGFGVDTPTAEAMAPALLRLTLDKARRLEMSAAAATFARNEFGVPRMVARTRELYKKQW